METLVERVHGLKTSAAVQEGWNMADTSFLREVDSLLNSFYDDIGRMIQIGPEEPLRPLLLKGLYVARHSTSIATLPPTWD